MREEGAPVSLAQLVRTMHSICKIQGSNTRHHQRNMREECFGVLFCVNEISAHTTAELISRVLVFK